jgi:hypothetical protein
MTSLPILIRTSSLYEDDDMSRVRTGITINTLAASLGSQTDQDFDVFVSQFEGDKHTARRIAAFPKYIGGCDYPRIQVECSDDDFLAPQLVEYLGKWRDSKRNIRLTFNSGYVLIGGELKVFRNRPMYMLVNVIAMPDKPVMDVHLGSDLPSWIHVRHQYSESLETPDMHSGREVSGLNWAGWNQSLVAKYAAVTLRSATAAGVTVCAPRRVVFGSSKAKRKHGRRS